jgi:hypothetical protein
LMNLIEGLLRPQDVITVHYYGGVPLDLYMNSVIDRVHARETWLTETGYDGSDEPGQAKWLRQLIDTFNLHSRTSSWKKVFPYVLFNNGATDEAFVRPDWTNKPAFTAYRNRIPHPVRQVTLQASGGQLVVAPPPTAPTDPVRANGAAPGPLSTFSLMDLNGGSLTSGDWVLLATADGRFLRADSADQMKADRDVPSDWFLIHAIDPDPIVSGSRVALRYFKTHKYASAVGGGGGVVTVAAATVGPSEIFQIAIS